MPSESVQVVGQKRSITLPVRSFRNVFSLAFPESSNEPRTRDARDRRGGTEDKCICRGGRNRNTSCTLVVVLVLVVFPFSNSRTCTCKITSSATGVYETWDTRNTLYSTVYYASTGRVVLLHSVMLQCYGVAHVLYCTLYFCLKAWDICILIFSNRRGIFVHRFYQ